MSRLLGCFSTVPLLTSTTQNLVSANAEVSWLRFAAQALSTSVSLPWAALTVITESADGSGPPGTGISDVWDTGQCPSVTPQVISDHQLISVVSVPATTSCCLLPAWHASRFLPFFIFFLLFYLFEIFLMSQWAQLQSISFSLAYQGYNLYPQKRSSCEMIQVSEWE